MSPHQDLIDPIVRALPLLGFESLENVRRLIFGELRAVFNDVRKMADEQAKRGFNLPLGDSPGTPQFFALLGKYFAVPGLMWAHVLSDVASLPDVAKFAVLFQYMPFADEEGVTNLSHVNPTFKQRLKAINNNEYGEAVRKALDGTYAAKNPKKVEVLKLCYHNADNPDWLRFLAKCEYDAIFA